MVNLTPDSIVYNCTAAELHRGVRNALDKAAKTILDIYSLQDVDLNTITTKTNIVAVFTKFVQGRVLTSTAQKFDQSYVGNAFDAYKKKTGQITKDHFIRLLLPDEDGAFAFKPSYRLMIRPGIGLLLLALHSNGLVTLPISFRWPSIWSGGSGIGGKRREIGKLVSSELLAFIRGLDTQSDLLPHPAFESVGHDRKRREWFLTYGTKLLLATGWHKPEDVNIPDLIAIKEAEQALSDKELPLAYKALLDVLKVAFGERVRVTSEDWAAALRETTNALRETTNALRETTNRGSYVAPRGMKHLFESGPRSDDDIVDELMRASPAWGDMARIKKMTRLPGLDFDAAPMTETWIGLEELYIRKTPRESYAPIRGAFKWWNIYLFLYLPYWFARTPSKAFPYPSSPSLLLKSVFVSRLLMRPEESPITFVEFMTMQSERRSWQNNAHYQILSQLESFFQFIERYSEELPGCAGFTQPLSNYDYPRTSRRRGTKKQPIPRRFFAAYLDYHEALLAYHSVITARLLGGEIDSEQVKEIVSFREFIDTFAHVDIVGFVPLLFTRTRTVPLRFIPNVLDLKWRKLRDGRTVFLPHPHALHQNLVALHTGLRHNHIQWLDRDRFDSLVDDEEEDFALLLVNTDKAKSEPWTPYVSMRVIELLRKQLDWSAVIGESNFNSVHFYNDNPSTKWPKIHPVFSYTKDGKPHDDNVYAEAWKKMLCGFQGIIPELAEYGRARRLVTLLPPGHKTTDAALEEKLVSFGAGAEEYCELRPMTEITPHSARVAVVSQYITFLPTDLIGIHITGQKPATVAYYVHLEREVVEAEQVHQAARMREEALRNAFEPVLKSPQSSTFVHADAVNSRLAQSMRANLEETIIAHGCMSITFSDRAVNGIDVLRETKGARVAMNKTEICPYSNNCPSEVVLELRGQRRCSLCFYAVRSIDHLPAVVARKRQVAEEIDRLEAVLSSDAKALNLKYTPEELEQLEDERARLCEELTGWMLNEEVLDHARQKIVAGESGRRWVVQRPEIIERDLRRVATQVSENEYLLARLGECIAYPSLQSAEIRARFDLLRRELLARAGNLREAFASEIPIDPAAECAGILRTLLEYTGFSLTQLSTMLDSGWHLSELPGTSPRLLGQEEGT